MAKGIIVVEMPENCRDCLLRSLADDCICGRNVMEYRHNRNKPDWCPIHLMPEKREFKDGWHDNVNDFVDEIVAAGWNACIDKIRGA